VAIDEMPNDPWESFPVSNPYEGSVVELHVGDIAISRLMPTIMNGKCFSVWQNMTGSPEFISVLAPECRRSWLLFWLKTALVREYLLSMVRGSSASQKRFTEDDLADCPVPRISDRDASELSSEASSCVAAGLEASSTGTALDALADGIIARTKANIFDLLDDEKHKALVADAEEAGR